MGTSYLDSVMPEIESTVPNKTYPLKRPASSRLFHVIKNMDNTTKITKGKYRNRRYDIMQV